MIKVTNIERVNGVPYVKARMIYVRTGGMKEDKGEGQVFRSNHSLSNPDGAWYNVILVSDTEDIYKGDDQLNGTNIVPCITEGIHKPGRFLQKILASPGNLSQASLELIRAGEIKEGDSINLECEIDPEDAWNYNPERGNQYHYRIMLDQDGHVIIHQDEDELESQPRYSLIQMRGAIAEAWNSCEDNEDNETFGQVMSRILKNLK